MPLPFVSRSCETCLRQKKGDYILLNLNAAMQHARIHHSGWRYYSTAPNVAKSIRANGQPNATFQNGKASLRRKTGK
jgi:hypothetical protein